MGSTNQSQSPPHRARAFLSLAVLFVLLTILPSMAPAQQGALVVQRNLADLVDDAGIVVVGTIVYARVEPHPDYKNLPTVLVTVEVHERLKGDVGGVYVYRQAILDIREQFNRAGYKKGQRVLLLLAKPSRLGLSSPMGLSLGRFRVVEDARGEKFALNGLGNAGLFQGMRTVLRHRGIDPNVAEEALLEQERGPVKLEVLSGLIRKLVERP